MSKRYSLSAKIRKLKSLERSSSDATNIIEGTVAKLEFTNQSITSTIDEISDMEASLKDVKGKLFGRKARNDKIITNLTQLLS